MSLLFGAKPNKRRSSKSSTTIASPRKGYIADRILLSAYAACYGYIEEVMDIFLEVLLDPSTELKTSHPKALYRLGLCYLHIGSYQIAVELFRRAADRKCAKAQYSLGICYLGQIGVLRCYQEAEKYLVQAARQGNVDAQLTLCLRHDGHHKRVCLLYQHAADKEGATAQQLVNQLNRNSQSGC
ncbi:7738_t:CDS:2 [Paraglomus occultum]|uniref:7738_t:CDS:1 n=1 Tax=Paraglomus occultum TaxID=144539 RepID=A0A9N9FUJ9_9GLOM|nr:7738_t:CDS:2 [Paraglomus occultum]